MINLAYAVLVERALADDRAELVLSAHASQEKREVMARNREELDAWLAAPMGRQAAGESALLRELGVA